jgi:hypothetical protein
MPRANYEAKTRKAELTNHAVGIRQNKKKATAIYGARWNSKKKSEIKEGEREN